MYNEQPELISNYPIKSDVAFTPDQIESINELKDDLRTKDNRDKNLCKVVETLFWNSTTYSLVRFLLLSSGGSGIPLAIAATLIIPQLSNLDLINDIKIDRNEGTNNISGGFSLLRIFFSFITAGALFFSASRDYLYIKTNSDISMENITNKIETFNNVPVENNNTLPIVIGGLTALSGITILSTKKQQ